MDVQCWQCLRLCTRQLPSFELLAMVWMESLRAESNSLAACEAHSPGILQINSAFRGFWHANILVGHLLASEKDQLPSSDQVCTLGARSTHSPICLAFEGIFFLS